MCLTDKYDNNNGNTHRKDTTMKALAAIIIVLVSIWAGSSMIKDAVAVNETMQKNLHAADMIN